MSALATIFSTLALLVAGFIGIKQLNNPQPFGASVLSVYQGGTGRSSFPAHMVLTSASTTAGNLEASSTPQVGALIATTTSTSAALATSTFWGGLFGRQGVQFDDLVSCDTIDTDANGYLKCGSDGGGGGGGVDVAQKSKWATSTADATAIYTALAEKIGVSSSTPSTNLSVQGDALIAGTTTAKAFTATSTLYLVANGYLVIEGSASNDIITVGNNHLNIQPHGTGRVGIGSTTPMGYFSIEEQSDSTASENLFVIGDNGTTSPFLLVTGNGSTTIPDLVTGYMEFEKNSGAVTWIDMEVSTTTSNLLQSYTAALDGNSLFTIFGISANNGVTQTKIGIASTTPWGMLSVDRPATLGNFPMFVVGINGSSSPWMIIENDGNIGIGTTTPSTNLFAVHGSSLLAGTTTVQALVASSTVIFNTLPSGSGVLNMVCIGGKNELVQEANCTISSERYKHDIFDQESALSTIMALRPRRFKYNNFEENTERFGFIAEEVEKIDKRFVNYDKEGLPKSLRYEEMVSVLVKAIQEQQKEIQQLQNRVRILENATP